MAPSPPKAHNHQSDREIQYKIALAAAHTASSRISSLGGSERKSFCLGALAFEPSAGAGAGSPVGGFEPDIPPAYRD